MFRSDLVDREDPRYPVVSQRPALRLGKAVAAYHGRPPIDMKRFEDAAEVLGGFATMHGLAQLVLERKALVFFKRTDVQQFLKDDLPRILEEIYPSTRI